jgi:uncharacterized protein (DUF362 family)
VVAEGPGHERDTEAIVETVGLRDYMGSLNSFVDLNVDDVERVPTRTRASKLKELHLPKTLLRADFVVSMPKLKTHHWAGVTLSLKNMFGVVPGNCYGWPKNLLHWAGLTRSILDINSTVRPDFAIVDGIDLVFWYWETIPLRWMAPARGLWAWSRNASTIWRTPAFCSDT